MGRPAGPAERACGRADEGLLEQAFNSFNGYTQRDRALSDHVISDARESAAEHAAILDAFRAGVPAEAGAAMRVHPENPRTRVQAQE
ncbi:FCD domain-containing protein [Streptomyces tsukubensis]|uniref:GntR C-terminal domain-containing protein n=1 Tax=Streptomyces tsukubensis TaxID=83656 RepID=A0A1V4AFI1_9ACTN|nr:FCD domain-containing protein [Streptomyces tsukubensis]OON82642.1 hypothetical protein B1H18_00830 [Streptomyces tsukubensis]QFR92187.1 FCD domain-containing protein [Streptomyces tsukubensis]